MPEQLILGLQVIEVGAALGTSDRTANTPISSAVSLCKNLPQKKHTKIEFNDFGFHQVTLARADRESEELLLTAAPSTV